MRDNEAWKDVLIAVEDRLARALAAEGRLRGILKNSTLKRDELVEKREDYDQQHDESGEEVRRWTRALAVVADQARSPGSLDDGIESLGDLLPDRSVDYGRRVLSRLAEQSESALPRDDEERDAWCELVWRGLAARGDDGRFITTAAGQLLWVRMKYSLT